MRVAARRALLRALTSRAWRVRLAWVLGSGVRDSSSAWKVLRTVFAAEMIEGRQLAAIRRTRRVERWSKAWSWAAAASEANQMERAEVEVLWVCAMSRRERVGSARASRIWACWAGRG